MCKIMEEYAKEYSREATIDAIICYALKHNVSVDQLVQELHEDYGLDSVSALKRIEELTNKTA